MQVPGQDHQTPAGPLTFSCSLSDAGALADPALEERGFPPDILMEEMIPTLKLVIRAVRSGTVVSPFWQ